MPARFRCLWFGPEEPRTLPNWEEIAAMVETHPLPNEQSCRRIHKVNNDAGAFWAIGSRAFFKSRTFYFGVEFEALNAEFAYNTGFVPVARTLDSWTELVNNRLMYMTLETQLPGQSMDHLLQGGALSQADIQKISRQVGDCVASLSSYVCAEMRTLDGRPVPDHRLLPPIRGSTNMYSVATTDHEVFDNIILSIRHRLSWEICERLRRAMPTALPFTYCHADVHEGNVMVHNGEFSGLVDWELAGFYPRWWNCNASIVLSEHFPQEQRHLDAVEWFTVIDAIRRAHEHTNLWDIPEAASFFNQIGMRRPAGW
ncbi:hypothetical protein GQ53DRAFT_821807 [Thozetella sp. PMI_491]|nr:hypothetical protein GQ53DRAFT_821807 [Thozetella sp. PMI_491]